MTESLAAIGGSPSRMTIAGVEYEVRPLTIKMLGEFERFIRDEQQRQYVTFHGRFAAAGKPVGFSERAQAMARIVTQPFTFQDVVGALDTLTGARWVLSRVLHRDGDAVTEDDLDAMSAGAVLNAVNEVALKTGIIDASDLEAGSEENPTSPDPEP